LISRIRIVIARTILPVDDVDPPIAAELARRLMYDHLELTGAISR
jgi:hypothetical protein